MAQGGTVRRPFLALMLALTLFAVLAYIYALIKPEWSDEVWMMVPSANLAFYGFIGLGDRVIFAPSAANSQHYVYCLPPLSYVSMAGWFKVWGYNLMMARWHTIAWGVVLLLGLYVIGGQWNRLDSKIPLFIRLRYIGWNATGVRAQWVGVWAVLICALDYNFLNCCDARPDMMCAAIGIWAITLRSEWLAAITCLVHPLGWLYAILLWVLKRKVNPIPYLIAITIYVAYAMQAPDIWWQQITGHYITYAYRMVAVEGPMAFLGFDVGWRLLLLVVYLACAWLTIRRNLHLAWWFLIVAAPVLIFVRTTYYFPHVIPLFALCVAIQMRRYPWLCLIIIPQMVFAVTTLIPLWA